jgi:hypothetical protein
MLRGAISDNTADGSGGGVYFAGTEKFSMEGGAIRYNSARKDKGAGVYLALTSARLAMKAFVQGSTTESPQVDTENPVWLKKDGALNAKLLITGALSQAEANIEGDFTGGEILLEEASSGLLSGNRARFQVKGVSGKIGSDGKYTP